MSKAPDENPVITAAITTCQVSATRATFLAGYAYYQCGRYNFATGSDPSYIWFFRITFELCVLASFTSEFVSYYIHRMPTEVSKLELIKRCVAFPRLVFQCFLWALVCYSLALSRIGEVYYPMGCPAKIIPQIIFAALPVMLVGQAMYVIYTSNTLEAMSDSDVKKEIDAHKNMNMNHFLIGGYEGIVQRVRKQSDVLAGRAVYVAGMSQAGLWSYRMAALQGGTGLTPGTWYKGSELVIALGKMYLTMSSFALSFGLFAAMTLSCVTVFVQDMQDDNKKIALTFRCLRLIKCSFYAYFGSFLCLALAVLFMPWGCQYIEQAHINVPIAAFAALVCVMSLYWCFQSYKMVKDTVAREEEAALVAAPLTADELRIQKEHEVDESRFVSGTLNQINNFGAQGTLASGFVFYNVVTFFTDVIGLSYQDQNTSNIFLFFNVLSICAGLMCAVLDSLITGFTNQFVSRRESFLFLQFTKSLGRMTELCFYLGMGSWYALFAVCGYTKFTMATPLPAICSIIAVIISIMGSTYMDSAFSWVNVGRWSSKSVDALSEVDKLKLDKRSGVFSTVSYNVLFLGGFAYNCIIFFNFQLDQEGTRYRSLEQAYVAITSACFALSISIITLSSTYDTFCTNCLSKLRAYEFALLVEPIFNASMVAAALVVLLLVMAFGMIGFVKYRPFYPNWELMAPVMLWTSVITFVLIAGIAFRIKMHVTTVREECKGSQSSGGKNNIESRDGVKKTDQKSYDFSKALTQYSVLSSTSSFVAGNVCYEILFSEAKKTGADVWQSYWYFVCNNITFSFGVCTVSLTTLMTLAIWSMETVAEKHLLASRLHLIKGFLFFMSFSSLFFWMFGTIVGDGVKYTGNHFKGGEYSSGFSSGIFCCAIAIYVGVSVKRRSDDVLNAGKVKASVPAVFPGAENNPLHHKL